MVESIASAVVKNAGDLQTWLTVREAAARARCSVKILYRAVSSGRLRAARLGGRGALRFRAAWIDSWIESCAPQEISTTGRSSAGVSHSSV